MTRILLVEDDAMSRDMLTRHLRRRGYEVKTARDGEAAVELASRERPDLVLMDLGLPLLDGWEATRRIKAHDATIPVIALTALHGAEDRRRAWEAGCDDYITKPVRMPQLFAAIERLAGAQV